MQGLMMDAPLLIKNIAQHAEGQHGKREIVSITAENNYHKYTYSECLSRARRISNLLDSLNVSDGAAIGTLAWNDYRHLELYYGVSCAGKVLHTINPRLFEEQLIYIVNHAKDEVLFFDSMFAGLVEKIAPKCPSVRTFVELTEKDSPSDVKINNLAAYEVLIGDNSENYDWPNFEETRASSLCYTSGTTGNPKGVLYSHRSTVLHTYAVCLPDSACLSALDSILAVVPMFHVNAWGYPYAGLMVGAKLVFPGPKLGDPETLVNLINNEEVTIAGGVPTVWTGLLNYLRESGRTLGKMNRTIIGGSACPLSMIEEFRDNYKVEVLHGWGMTEMSPLGVINQPTSENVNVEGNALRDQLVKQGRPIPGVEVRIVDDEGGVLPWDGTAFGALQTRGPWVCSSYYKTENPDASHTDDGWFDTGDVATIDSNGYVKITDRTKDVIKSGGEWISSIDLENTAMSHPKVNECAVIGMYHPKWEERPLLVVVAEAPQDDLRRSILEYFDGKVAKWWIPEDVVFVTELPYTATGKVSKLKLRENMKGYQFPDSNAGQ